MSQPPAICQDGALAFGAIAAVLLLPILLGLLDRVLALLLLSAVYCGCLIAFAARPEAIACC